MFGEPEWLPELLLLDAYAGVWARYFEAVYRSFEVDFTRSQPMLSGRRVGYTRHPEVGGKAATFWHLVSAGQSEATRLPDVSRCERIRWPRAMIEAVASNRVRRWNSPRPGQRRILIALPDFSYMVVLEDRRDYLLLWTAYPIELERRRAQKRREYEEAQRKS